MADYNPNQFNRESSMSELDKLKEEVQNLRKELDELKPRQDYVIGVNINATSRDEAKVAIYEALQRAGLKARLVEAK